jgi:hypothetical protein
MRAREMENKSRGPTFGDFVTIRVDAGLYSCKTTENKSRLHSPNLLNVMYCVKVSLWTVKIFLAQYNKEKGVVGNLGISLMRAYYNYNTCRNLP